jgi:hypothetical protein
VHLERWTSPSGKRRWLTGLDPREARSYADAVSVAFPRLQVGPRSFAVPTGPGRPWRSRLAWRRTVETELASARLVIVSDVADCYPSIGETAIRRAVRRAGGDPAPLLAQLRYLGAGGVHGVPVGPPPSATVAEAVLSIADARARAAGVAPIRWVDDVVFAGDRDAVRRAERAWRSALAELGLRENGAKRRQLDPIAGDVIGVIGPPSRTARIRHGIIRSS